MSKRADSGQEPVVDAPVGRGTVDDDAGSAPVGGVTLDGVDAAFCLRASEDDLVAASVALAGLVSRAQAARARVVAELETRGTTRDRFSLSTSEFLAFRRGVSTRQARRVVREAVRITGHQTTLAAVESGRLSWDQGLAVADGLAVLNGEDPDIIAVVEAAVLEGARSSVLIM